MHMFMPAVQGMIFMKGLIMNFIIRNNKLLAFLVVIFAVTPIALLVATVHQGGGFDSGYIHAAFIISILCLFCVSLMQNHLEKHQALMDTTRKFLDQNKQLEQEVEVRKKAQKQVEYNEARLKTIIKTIKTCIVIIDSNTHEIIDVNPAAEKAIGAPKEEIVGRRCQKFICPGFNGACPVTDKGHVIYDAERILLRADETEVPVLKTVTAVKLGNRDCLLESFVDISEQKKVEQHLQKAKELAEASALAKSQFLANVSHEIRTPMNAIIGFGSILLEEELSETQKSYVELIHNSSTNLLTIINDILDFSKIDAGKMTIENEPCNLKQLMSDLNDLFQSVAAERKLEYVVNISDDVPYVILTDTTRLRQCLVNLINNAIKFTHVGHVHVNVGIKNINNKPFVYFEVDDTGIGIPHSRQGEIFQSFTQADGGTCREYGGTGLGLTITKQLAVLLGGDIDLESIEGKGSVFTLHVPANRPKTHVEEPPAKTVRNFVPRANSISALVVDDSHANQTLIKILLEKHGTSVTLAENGKEALELAQANHYDIIFMDLHMPIMDGEQAARAMIEKGITTPIVVMTAESKDDAQRFGLSEWSAEYLRKPIDRDVLVDTLVKYTKQQLSA